MDFYTIGSSESMCDTFTDMKNFATDEPMDKNDMAKFLEDTNKGTHAQGGSCALPFFGNVGAPSMATLNIPRLNVGLLISLCTTLNVLNSHDTSQIRTLCQGYRTDFDPLSSAPVKSDPCFSPSSGESLGTSNQKSKRNRKRNSKKNKSLTSSSHVGDLSPTSASHVGGKKPASTSLDGSISPVTTSYNGIKSPTYASRV